ncbi:hypothetical protein BDF19DRAFT_445987 [Syncephalis fuscata]|nr:hypothetical protein BDF19DRAFT_445987 [Syncephalis fuscata]
MDQKLKTELEFLRNENTALKTRIQLLESQLEAATATAIETEATATVTHDENRPLTNGEIRRYGRQLILPNIGVSGQLRLKQARVLVVGAGGLGAPALLYLSAAGIGQLGIIDHDTVDIGNLHRQVIHNERRVGRSKAESAAETVRQLNRYCSVDVYDTALSSDNAMNIVAKYDVILDCTDNVATRYLLNDVCVLNNKPLVSGSALRMDGQLVIYNYQNGPCYRCLYPVPPPPETVTNCADGGVLGVVPGIIGYYLNPSQVYKPSMLLFHGTPQATFRSIKLRDRRVDCAVCGDTPTIHAPIDYVQFCGAPATDSTTVIQALDATEQISCVVNKYNNLRLSNNHLLLDVRESIQFEICSLPNSLNIPLKQLDRQMDQIVKEAAERPVYVVCRLGNDSQLAVRQLREKTNLAAFDIQGGLYRWSHTVDSTFPIY